MLAQVGKHPFVVSAVSRLVSSIGFSIHVLVIRHGVGWECKSVA